MSQSPIPNLQSPLRLAIVVQRYGEEVNGGAEQHARWLAEHLLTLAQMDVITTTARDYTTWADYFPAGQSELNGVNITRFAVDETRHWEHAQKATGRILNFAHTLFDELTWIKEQGPYSTPLLRHLEASYHQYDAFIFFTYLYATTFFGLPLVSDKAILVPTAHADPFLEMPAFRSLFHLPKAIVYNTKPERELIERVMNNGHVAGEIAGIGINTPPHNNPEAFRQKYHIQDDFLLYVGRISDSKNINELVDFFIEFRRGKTNPFKLVLAGRPTMPILEHPDIITTGFISEQDKFDGIAASSVVVMPSRYESLSMLALEAWLMGKPMLVNGNCAVLRHQCKVSNGGLYYTNQAEFSATLTRLLDSADLRQAFGQQGQAFAEANYNWDVILAKYQAIFDRYF